MGKYSVGKEQSKKWGLSIKPRNSVTWEWGLERELLRESKYCPRKEFVSSCEKPIQWSLEVFRLRNVI